MYHFKVKNLLVKRDALSFNPSMFNLLDFDLYSVYFFECVHWSLPASVKSIQISNAA